MSFTGSWDATMKTPIGSITAVFTFTEKDGAVTGVAVGSDGDAVAMTDLHTDGDHITWRQSITKPLRLNLEFSLTRDGDTLVGTSRAGRLPQTKVTAIRTAT